MKAEEEVLFNVNKERNANSISSPGKGLLIKFFWLVCSWIFIHFFCKRHW